MFLGLICCWSVFPPWFVVLVISLSLNSLRPLQNRRTDAGIHNRINNDDLSHSVSGSLMLSAGLGPTSTNITKAHIFKSLDVVIMTIFQISDDDDEE